MYSNHSIVIFMFNHIYIHPSKYMYICINVYIIYTYIHIYICGYLWLLRAKSTVARDLQ